MATTEVEPELISDPSFIKLYSWEKFDFPKWRLWMAHNWTWSIWFTVIYVLFIAASKFNLRFSEAYGLRRPLLLWNVGLAFFSMVACARTFPELVHVVTKSGATWFDGIHNSICSRDELTYGFAFWALIGTWSKVVELGDTAFITLRKQPLIFLHWYHHATVMLYTWYTYASHDPCHRWFMAMNYFVHSVMYSYYALKSLRVKIPKSMAMCITSLQLLQMVVGVYVNVHGLIAIRSGVNCSRSLTNIYLALAMYATYLILFAQFFYGAYFTRKMNSGKRRYPIPSKND